MELCGGELLDKFKFPSHLHLTWVRVSFSSSGRCANLLVCILSFSNLMLFSRLSHVQCTQTELICLRYLTIQLDSHEIDPHHQKSRPVNYNTWTFLVLELVHVMSFTIWLDSQQVDTLYEPCDTKTYEQMTTWMSLIECIGQPILD